MGGIVNAITVHAFVSVVAVLGLIGTHVFGHSDPALDSALVGLAGGAAWGLIQRQKTPLDPSTGNPDELRNDR